MTSQTIWGSTDRGPATGTMRFPVDINSSSGPGYLSVTELSVFMWATPTLVTPVLGVATATSINKLTLTQPATGSTLTIDDGFTVHATANATISGTNTGDQTDATLSFTDITTNNSSTSKHGFLKKLNNDATYYMDGSGNWSVPAGGGGSGTVNSGTGGQLTYYATTGTAVSGNANATISAGALTLGIATSVLGTLVLSGSTSGSVTIIPQVAAGTWNFNLPITAGTAGQVLTSQGGGASAMTWTSAGTGTVTGPVSSTDTAIARFNGTGGTTLQNSGVLIDSSNNVSGIGTLASGAHTITSASATSLVIGPNGATNPMLTIDSSTSTAADGLKITGAAAGSGVTITTTSSGANAPLTINTIGTGNMTLNAQGTNLLLRVANTTKITLASAATTFALSASGTASTVRYSFTGAADTTLTASAEAPSTYFNLGQTRQHATGALTLQRDFRITGSTHSAVGASTITDAATFSVDGGPLAGTNATITNSHGLYIPTLALSGTITNGFAATIAAPSGATNNYAMKITGQIVRAGSAPSVAAGTGAGTSPTGPTMDGASEGGTITVTTGTSCAGSNATIATITFANAYPNGSAIVLTPGNANAAALAVAAVPYAVGSGTTFLLKSGSSALTDATAYIWNYRIIGY